MISIIVPIYNAEKTIRRCINSIINQTYREFELILVDDGSSDHSFEICSEYKGDNIYLYHNENNGVGYARNFGMNKANGDYITFCDADDFYSPDRLGTLVEAINHTKADILINGYYVSFDNNPFLVSEEKSKFINKSDVIKSIMLNNNIGGFCWNKIFRREILRDATFPLELTHCEDTYFLLSSFKFAKSIYYVAKPLNYYCDNDNSVTRNLSKVISKTNCSQYTVAYEKILSDFKLSNVESNYFKIMIYKNSLALRKKYIKHDRRNKTFIRSLTHDIKKYRKYYFHSSLFSTRNKLRSLITDITFVF